MKHRRGGGEPAVQHTDAGGGQSAGNGGKDALRGNAAVVPHGDGKPTGRLAGFRRKPQRKAVCQPYKCFVGQIHRLSGDSFTCHAADIRSAFQLFPVGI